MMLWQSVCYTTIILYLSEMIYGEPARCTRKCRVDEKDSECWDQSLDYFTNALQKALNEYAGTLIHIQKWKYKHPELSYKVKRFVETSLNTSLFLYNKDGQKPLTKMDMFKIFDVVLKQTQNHYKHYEDPAVLAPHFSCPIPCDYYPKIWSALASISFIVLILFIISFFIYVCTQQKKLSTYALTQFPRSYPPMPSHNSLQTGDIHLYPRPNH